MNANRDLERRLAEHYASEGLLRAPDRVLTSALATIESIPQRRVFRRAPWRFPRMFNSARLATAIAVGIFAVIVGVWALSPHPNPAASPTATATQTASPAPTGTPTATDGPNWTGRVRSDGPSMAVLRMTTKDAEVREWQDSRDTAVEWVDITRLEWPFDARAPGSVKMRWRIQVAAKPPLAADLHPDRVLAYGLVFDTTRDGIADYEVGISNDAPSPGDFRTWVTDLSSATTREQIGPPYGKPVEFSHPDYEQPGNEPSSTNTVSLYFLPITGGAPPPGVDTTARYYAWASLTEGGQVVAWDYAPDFGWLDRTEP